MTDPTPNNAPPPEPPTDEAWQEFIEQVQRAQHVAIREGESPRFDLVECALALWREAIPPVPEPVVPTDEEIMELMPQQMRDDLANAARALAGFDRANAKAAGAMRIILNRQAVNHVRAVLARWGTPNPITKGFK
jgi:hypothetical protein